MNQVTLTAEGLLEMQTTTVSARPLQFLGYRLRLSPGCTLRSWFKMLRAYPPFTELGDFFQVLLAQYDRCPSRGCGWPEYSGLQFAKIVEMIGYPGQPRLEVYNSFRGLKDNGGTEEIRSLPLEVLLDMPMALGHLKHIVFGDSVDTFEFETVYTLFEFIDGIAWELSFHGAPPECQLRS